MTVTAQRAGPAAAGRRRRRLSELPIFGLICVAPAFAFAGVFLYYPAVSAIVHAFTQWDGSSSTFTGLTNFLNMRIDPELDTGFRNDLTITLIALVLELTIPLAVAKMILGVRQTRVQHFVRVLFVIPLIVPQVLIYLLWQFIYDPNVGLLNALLGVAHLPIRPDWLGDPRLALFAIIGTGAGVIAPFPFVDGFGLLIYTAGLQSIPQDVIESSHLDGAGPLSRFWHIEVPLILGQLRLMSVLTIVAGVQQFTAVLILTDGGPGFQTYVPGLSIYYNAFYYGNFGYACAIGTALFLIILVLSILNLRFVRPPIEYDASAGS
jgi:raffinose/stachyose/melibiose transport system permease protein